MSFSESMDSQEVRSVMTRMKDEVSKEDVCLKPSFDLKYLFTVNSEVDDPKTKVSHTSSSLPKVSYSLTITSRNIRMVNMGAAPHLPAIKTASPTPVKQSRGQKEAPGVLYREPRNRLKNIIQSITSHSVSAPVSPQRLFQGTIP